MATNIKSLAVKFTGIQFTTDCDDCLTFGPCWLIAPTSTIPNTKANRESLVNQRLCNECWADLELELLAKGIYTYDA